MLIDLHAHTSGISYCCQISAEDNIIKAKELGFDGLAIANHYTSYYYLPDEYDEWIEKYISEWHLCEELGKKHGIKIFKAIEVTMEYEPRLHMLIYGCDESFIRSNPRLCDMSLKELYDICKRNNCALIQAHPFRGGATVQDTDLLDGIEINCHPLYKNSYSREILKIAGDKGLQVTVGCDYHADTYRPLGGTFIPDDITNEQELAQFLLSSNETELQIQEPADKSVYKITYKR